MLSDIHSSIRDYVEIRFKEYGLDGLEVIDNGSGITEHDLATVGEICFTAKWETGIAQITLLRPFV